MKFSKRVVSSENEAIVRRVKYLRNLDYEVLAHDFQFNPEKGPVATIVILVHDRELRHVLESLSSAANQTYENTEIIIIDHGTSGEVKEAVDRYFQKLRSSKLIRLSNNLYDPSLCDFDDIIPNLWNAALFASEGSYIYFLSSDDRLSLNYVDKMIGLFVQNPLCTSAAPAVVSINKKSEVNKAGSISLALGNQRGRYTDGVALARAFMKDKCISFPGGLLMQNTQVVLERGGFDKMNDLSQIFKFAIFGVSGFDPRATLFWRHHDCQENVKLKSKGVVWYRDHVEFLDNYSIYHLHEKFISTEFADLFRSWYLSVAKRGVVDSIVDSFRLGGWQSLSLALRNAFKELPLRLFFEVLSKSVYAILKGVVYKFGKKVVFLILCVLEGPLRMTFRIQVFQRLLVSFITRSWLSFGNLNQSGGIEVTVIEHQYDLDTKGDKLLSLVIDVQTIMRSHSLEAPNWLFPHGGFVPFLYDFNNHFYFITVLADVVRPDQVVEIGSGSGSSMWAWLRSSYVSKIISYDVVPMQKNRRFFVSEFHEHVVSDVISTDSRWEQRLGDLSRRSFFREQHSDLEGACIIFFDGPCNGSFERQVIDLMFDLKNEGDILLVFSNIRVGSMVRFWNDLAFEKFDISCIASQSGTGLAVFPSVNRRIPNFQVK